MQIEKLFVALAVDAAEYIQGLDDATAGGVAWAADWGTKVSAAVATAFLVGVVVVGTALVAVGAMAFSIASDIQDASRDIQSQLGATAEEAAELGEIAADVWANNFAESVDEATQALVQVRQQLGDLSDEELQGATENAFRLADTFDTGVNENIHAAGVLMNEFGLSQGQAFDFITTGFQKGLNSSDDFLDSIGEYSNLFADAGFGAGEFFSLMETGNAGGVLGTDKVADAIKEMSIFLGEGKDDAVEAFDALGIGFDEASASVAAGDEAWADFFPQILEGLASIEDPIEKNRLQVALFGTMAEDLGVSFTDGLSVASTSLDDMADSTAALDVRYDTLGDVVEGFKRRGILALRPIGDVLLGLANRIMPLVEDAFAFLETTILPIIETVADAVTVFVDEIDGGAGVVDAFATAFGDLVPPEVIDFLIQLRDEILPEISAWFEENVEPVLEMVAGFVGWQDILIVLAGSILAVVIPAIISLVLAIAPILLAIGAVILIVAFLRNAWENDWGGIQGKVQAVIQFISDLIVSVMTFIQEFWDENGKAITTRAQETWTLIQDAVLTAITFIRDQIIIPVMTFIRDFWEENSDSIKATAETVWQAILDFISGIWDSIDLALQAFVTLFTGDWEGFLEDAQELWETIWTTVTDFIGTLWGLMQPLFQGMWENLQGWWNGIDWAGLGRSIIDGLVNGLSAGVGLISSKLREIGSAAMAAWNDFWGSSSPSRLMMESVRDDIGGGAALGFEQMANDLESTIPNVADMLFNNLSIQPASIADRLGDGSGTRSDFGGGRGPDSSSYTYNNYGNSPDDPVTWFQEKRKVDRIRTR